MHSATKHTASRALIAALTAGAFALLPYVGTPTPFGAPLTTAQAATTVAYTDEGADVAFVLDGDCTTARRLAEYYGVPTMCTTEQDNPGITDALHNTVGAYTDSQDTCECVWVPVAYGDVRYVVTEDRTFEITTDDIISYRSAT